MGLIQHNLPTQFPAYPVVVNESNNLTPVTLLEAGFRHSRLWMWTFGVIVVATVVITAFTSRQYQSEMNIIVQNARGTMVITPERTTGASTVSGVTEEQVNSEMEILRSKEIAEAAIDPKWPSASHTAEESQTHDKAVEQFRKNLGIELIRKSNVIHVVYTAKSPEEAQAMLKRLLNAFLSKQREIELPSGASAFFAGQASQYKQQLETAEHDLAAFQQKAGVVSLPEREMQLEKEVSDLEADKRLVDLQFADLSLNSRTHEVLAMGHDAWQMIGRTPGYIVAVRPLRGGAITDFDITQRLIRLLF